MSDFKAGGVPTPDYDSDDINYIDQKTEFTDDIFVYGDINRICPEAPVPVIQPTHQTDNGGMSKNVQKNIEVLGYKYQYNNFTIISNE